jgi:hypothetical protein
LEDIHLDECVNCGAGLLAVSDICPQCGFLKSKGNELIEAREKAANDIELDESEEKSDSVEIENYDEFVEKVADDIKKNPSRKKSTKVKNKISRPAGIRLISISYMLFGIGLLLFGIIFVSAVTFLVMSDVMGTLGGIGGGMGNMPMLPGMGGIDASTKSSLGNIIDLNRIAGSPSASEIEMRMNSSGVMNMNVMMDILGETAVIAIIEIIVGLVIFGIGLFLFKGKKLARPAIIISSIISVPLVASFVTVDTLVLLGMVAFNGMILYYMLKSKAREYFNQTSTKKSKIKTSPAIKVKSSKVKQTVESEFPVDKPTIKSASTQSRPLGVTIIAILQILSGLFNLSVGIFSGTLAAIFGVDVLPATVLLGLIGGGLIIHGVSQLVTAWGVLKGKSWAWKLTLVLIIIGIILAAIREDVFAVIVNVTWGVIFVYYLFRPHVKDYFGIIVKTTH